MNASTAAQRHRVYASRFADVIAGVTDWDASTPVAEWRTRDVVAHLTTWFPQFLAAGGVEIPAGDPADPTGSWTRQAAAVQHLLDDEELAGSSFTHPRLPAQPLAATIDTFYTSDIFMHTWDLARSSGQDDTLDEATCAEMLAGMEGMAAIIRESGQYGDQQPVAEGASVQQRLFAFIGRDPDWRP